MFVAFTEASSRTAIVLNTRHVVCARSSQRSFADNGSTIILHDGSKFDVSEPIETVRTRLNTPPLPVKGN